MWDFTVQIIYFYYFGVLSSLFGKILKNGRLIESAKKTTRNHANQRTIPYKQEVTVYSGLKSSCK